MTYKTFDFPFHSVTHAYPTGDQVQFGRGYSHASEPDGPVQRSFLLKFNALTYIQNPTTGLWLRAADVGYDTLKKRSIWCLNDFYAEHLLHKKFYYSHYVFGTLVVRFAQAFQMPEAASNTRNVQNDFPTAPFELRLIEQPE